MTALAHLWQREPVPDRLWHRLRPDGVRFSLRGDRVGWCLEDQNCAIVVHGVEDGLNPAYGGAVLRCKAAAEAALLAQASAHERASLMRPPLAGRPPGGAGSLAKRPSRGGADQ
jgi:hypothetical protein